MVRRFQTRPALCPQALILCATGVLGAVGVAPAHATPHILDAFRDRYPTSTLLARMQAATGFECFTCHQPPDFGARGNCYRIDLIGRLNARRSPAEAVNDIDGWDSDGDGVPNGVEITMRRDDMPNHVGYNPGLTGGSGKDPCADNPSLAVSGQLETPPAPRCIADVDNGSGSGTPDGGVTIDDLIYYLFIFEAGDLRSDVDDGSGTGTLDGGVTIDDLLYYLARFEAGC